MTTLQIVLSEMPPVIIDTDKWPVIAEADHYFRDVKASITVREHADGRRIVYCYTDAPAYPSGGWLLGEPELGPEVMTEDTIRHIRRCAGIIRRPEVGDRCIADLPAVEI